MIDMQAVKQNLLNRASDLKTLKIQGDQKTRLSVGHLDPIEEQLTLVHEYVHVFRKEHNTQEARWLEEGLAKFWEYKYSHVWPQSYNLRFSKNPYFILTEDEAHYGRNGDGYISSFFLITYLYQHFGGDHLIQKLMKSDRSGWDNITNSIQELIEAKLVSMPAELITKKSILRHLAVALWTNDPYSAKYALFFIDQNFEAAALSSKFSHNVIASNSIGVDSVITYSPIFKDDSAENFVITNYEPFEIKPAKAPSNGKVFIHIE